MSCCGKQIAKQNFTLYIHYSNAIIEVTAVLKTEIKETRCITV